MTTNSDQPNQPGNDQQQPPADDQAQPQGQAQDQGEADAVDIDQKAIDDAKAEVEAEKASAGGEETSTVDPANPQGQQQQDQSQQPPAGQQQPPQGGDAVMIPKARLDEALGKQSKAEQEAAYWKGIADARGQQQPTPQGGQPGGQTQPQQPTAEQRLAAIQTEQDALATKYDDGEITMADLTKAKRDLDNREQGIREEILLAKVQPKQQPAKQDQPDLFLDVKTAELEEQHPWVKIYEQVGSPIDWKYVEDRALENCKERGLQIVRGNPVHSYELRKEVAALMDKLGPNMIGDRAKAKGIAIPGQQQQQQQPGQRPATMSQTAQSRASKLELAANAPPNLSRMTGTTQDDGTPSESRLETMNEDEIGNLPDATRRRLLGTL